MLFRGTLVRLWAWYFLLLVFILACFNVIVYFSLSQALNARVTADLQAKVRDTVSQLIANPNGTLTAYGPAADPSLADTFVFVIQTNKNGDPTVVENSPQLNGLEQLPSQLPIQAAKQGTRTQSTVTISQDQFAVLTEPIKDKQGNVIGVIQAAKPVGTVAATLANLEGQLALATGVALLLGAIVALLMANKSLHPVRRAFVRQREFVADASHELRTPLTLIKTNAEAWLRRTPHSAAGFYARHILEEVDQLSSLVSDLTTLALADARQLRLRPEPVELSQALRELIAHAAPLVEERSLRLESRLEPVTIEADPTRLRQLLLILLDNALATRPWEARSAWPPTAWAVGPESSSRIRAAGSRPATCPTSSSASTGLTRRAPGSTAAPVSAWRSRRGSSRPTAARSRCAASPAAAPRSRSRCPHSQPPQRLRSRSRRRPLPPPKADLYPTRRSAWAQLGSGSAVAGLASRRSMVWSWLRARLRSAESTTTETPCEPWAWSTGTRTDSRSVRAAAISSEAALPAGPTMLTMAQCGRTSALRVG